MGRAVVYCEKCGELISEEDFLNGKAVTSNEKNYCKKCKGEVADLLPDEPQPPRAGSSRNMPSPSAESKTGSRIIRKTGTGVYRKTGSGVRRAVQPPAEDPGTSDEENEVQRSPRAGKSNMPIFAAIGGVAVIIVIAIVLFAKSKPGSTPDDKKAAETQKAEDGARQQLASVISANGSDPDKVLAAVNDAAPKLTSDKNRLWVEELKKEWTQKTEAKKRNDQIVARRDALDKKANDPNEDAGALIKQWEEFCSDKALQSYGELKDLAKSLADIRRRLSNARVRREIAKVDEYASQNPEDYQTIAGKYLDIGDLVEEEPPSNDTMDTITKNFDRFAGVLSGRWTDEALAKEVTDKRQKWLDNMDAAGNTAIAALTEEVNGLLKEKKVDEALAKAQAFPKKFGGKFSQQADNIARNIEEQRKTAGGGTHNPPDKPPDQNPQGGRTINMFDSATASAWKTFQTPGVQSKWESKDGAWVGSFTGFDNPQTTSGMAFTFFDTSMAEDWKDYEVQFEFKPVKGNFVVMLWQKQEGQSINLTLLPTFIEFPIKEGAWHSATLTVKGNVARITVKDCASRVTAYNMVAGMKTSFGFLLASPGTEVEFKPGQAKITK